MGMTKYMPETGFEQIRIFIADMYNAIPFLILESENIDNECTSKNAP